MNWVMILLAYTVTSENVPHEVKTFELQFANEALCQTARQRVEEDLKTRAITVKATCVQTTEGGGQ
ncbi:MAG: hypothetical protein WBO29_15935 [Albidovulum sp.]